MQKYELQQLQPIDFLKTTTMHKLDLMFDKLLYFGIILPLSKLPLFLLYRVSDFLYIIMLVIGYRKEVIGDNIQKAFTNKKPSEVKRIRRKFYRHFCDIIIESFKSFSMSNEEINRRFKYLNPEIADGYYNKNKNVIFCGGHYCNWEISAMASALQMSHMIKGIYMPLKNKFWDEKIKSNRNRTGVKFISVKEVKEEMSMDDGPFGTAFLMDQSPGNPKRGKWIKFLGRPTVALYGSEKYARKFNTPVFYFGINKVKRGYYEIYIEKICDDPSNMKEGEITLKVNRLLEKAIIQQPEYYLWSHRKWKHSKEFPGEYDF
jgi:KDO2-lipid IV(A) lauroyltransferase